MRYFYKLIPQILICVFAIWCVVALRGDLAQLSLATLMHSWDIVAFAILLSLLNYALRIYRWRYYLARLGHQMSYRFTALSYCAGFAYTLSPGKVGEMVRARYYLPLRVPLSDITAAFVAERLMDVIAMTGLAALIVTTSRRYDGAIGVAAALIVAALVVLTVIPWASFATSIEQRSRIPKALRAAISGFATVLASTRTLLTPRVLVAGFALGLLAWGLEGVGLGLLSSMFPTVSLAMASAVGIYAVAVLIGALSFLPSGLGGTEAAMTALLVANGHTLSNALLVTLTCRLVTLWLAVALGWLAVWLLRENRAVAVQP